MNKTWKKKDDCRTSNGEGITSPNGLGDHTPHKTRKSQGMWD